MITLPFIPKDNPEIPDNYGIKIRYVNGQVETFELAQHRLNETSGMLEFVSKEDIWSWVPLSSIQRLEFDSNMSKLVAIKEKMERKKNAEGKQINASS